ncbi:amidohydrolase family protein [Paracoccus limosus]|uniref:Amidohydrolase family protein n=1 Tax=Paracoccus limosus TaxID=913252 RepID=A0A844H9I6_9RHOB|nr:N-acetylglucosamine-6-phosphate deacetylase [Paracoccus limosus]MTH35287.1 amidohydrolase family protein [Paracoccus limosus]
MLISADLVWSRGALRPGLAVETRAGRVAALRPLGADTPDLHLPLLMPGLTDLQVNGGGGVLFNAEPSVAGITAIAAAHRRLGTARILPTVITDTPEVIEAAAAAVIAARAEGLAQIDGIHIEGPHIAPERRGTHDARFIRPLDTRTLAVLARLRAADVPVLLTLAPECCDPALLAQAVGLGVVVSAGHSRADAGQTRAALAAGVGMFTHLYNAMPQMQSRDPGIIAAALLSDAWCGLIADGIHVAPEMLALAMAARPRRDRCFLVSDAMPTVGGPDRFRLYGMDIAVRDGALVNPEGALAGAHVSLLDCVQRLVALTGTAPGRAIAMAGDLPRRAMRLPPLRIARGMAVADLIALDADLRLLPDPVP